MRRKKGFTLIELLAVIVILAIIALIATPIILKIVEDAKKDAFLRSVELVVSTTDMDIAMKTFENEFTYTITDGTVSNLELGIKNIEGMNGTIEYNREGEVSYAMHNDKWCVVNVFGITSVIKYEGRCSFSTDASAFTYKDIKALASYEKGDNCVNWFKVNKGYDDTSATDYCNGKEVIFRLGQTLINDVNDGNLDIAELEEAGVIKNAVIVDGVAIKDYDTIKGGTDVVIPAKINGKKVVSITTDAFNDNRLTSVLIPNSVISISYYAFYGNQLTSVIIPNSVISIGGYAFAFNQLTSVTIPSSVTSIEGFAFEDNQLTSVTIPSSVTSIEGFAFEDNQLTSITIPNSVTFVGPGAFNTNQLPDSQAFIYARNSDGSVDNSAIISYGGARKNGVIIPQGVVNIGPRAFSNNELTSVTLPNSVVNIDYYAFYGNQLTSVTIPNSVTTIDDGAFSDNQLTSVIIKGKSSTSDFTSYGSSVFGWASGYNNSNITFEN